MAITTGDFTTQVWTNASSGRTMDYNLMEGRNRLLVYVTSVVLGAVPHSQFYSPTFDSKPLTYLNGHIDGGYILRVSYMLEEDLPAGGASYQAFLPYPDTRLHGMQALFCANGVVQEVPYLHGMSYTGNGQTRSPVALTGASNGSLLFFTGVVADLRVSFTPDANYTEKWDVFNPYVEGGTQHYSTNTGITRLVTADGNYTLGATQDSGSGAHIGVALALAAIKNNFSAQINTV